MIQTTTTSVDTFQILDPIVVPPVGTDPLAYSESGLTNLTIGQQSDSITFQITKAGSYVFVELEVINTTDATPAVIDADVTAQSTTGFTVKLSGLPDTANYFLKWFVQIPP